MIGRMRFMREEECYQKGGCVMRRIVGSDMSYERMCFVESSGRIHHLEFVLHEGMFYEREREWEVI